jgi:hypothetical protein
VAHLGRGRLDDLLCLHLAEAHPSPDRCPSSVAGRDPRIQGAFCLNEGPWTRARTRGRVIDGREVCACDGDLARAGSGNVTGTGRRASGGGVAGAAGARDHAGRGFCQDSGLARHAGDVGAPRAGVCRGGARTGVCPRVDGAAVCRGLGPRGPSCPCGDARGRPAGGGHGTWACRGAGRRLARGRMAAGRRGRSGRTGGARGTAGRALA